MRIRGRLEQLCESLIQRLEAVESDVMHTRAGRVGDWWFFRFPSRVWQTLGSFLPVRSVLALACTNHAMYGRVESVLAAVGPPIVRFFVSYSYDICSCVSLEPFHCVIGSPFLQNPPVPLSRRIEARRQGLSSVTAPGDLPGSPPVMRFPSDVRGSFGADGMWTTPPRRRDSNDTFSVMSGGSMEESASWDPRAGAGARGSSSSAMLPRTQSRSRMARLFKTETKPHGAVDYAQAKRMLLQIQKMRDRIDTLKSGKEDLDNMVTTQETVKHFLSEQLETTEAAKREAQQRAQAADQQARRELDARRELETALLETEREVSRAKEEAETLRRQRDTARTEVNEMAAKTEELRRELDELRAQKRDAAAVAVDEEEDGEEGQPGNPFRQAPSSASSVHKDSDSVYREPPPKWAAERRALIREIKRLRAIAAKSKE